MGRFEFETHSAVTNGRIQYNTARDLFKALKAKEFYKTSGFKEIAFIYGDTDKSYRKTTLLINRIRYQIPDGTPCRTLQANTENEGSNLTNYINTITDRILKRYEFGQDGVYHGDIIYGAQAPAILPSIKVTNAAENLKADFDLNEMLKNPVLYENPEKSVNIAIDDVNVKKQEETREIGKRVERHKMKYVHNTVVHIKK